jgi:Sel1 repeat-containing protein
MKTPATMFAGVLALLVAAVGPAAANPNDHEATRPHYAAAAQGNADAQFQLGTVYLKGTGVPQSEALAFQWFMRAANKGHADAQLALSGMFANGQGVPRHDVLAYKWAALAESNASAADVRQRASEMVNLLARRMPEAELAEARRLAGISTSAAPAPEAALDVLEQPSPPTFELAARTTEPVRSQRPTLEAKRPVAESRRPEVRPVAETRQPSTDANKSESAPAERPRREPSVIRPAERRPGRLAEARAKLEMAHRTVSLIGFGRWQ